MKDLVLILRYFNVANIICTEVNFKFEILYLFYPSDIQNTTSNFSLYEYFLEVSKMLRFSIALS